MIRVALVEDEESSQRTLVEYLERFSQEINEKIHVSIFPDGAEIVEDYRGNYDIILMDILMRYMDGMEAASEIRKVDKEVVILFITSTPQYVMKGYTVDALTTYHFFRCNKCYLVNLEHVNGVNENCADVDGDQIQVSRPKKKAFLDALNNYINEVGK